RGGQHRPDGRQRGALAGVGDPGEQQPAPLVVELDQLRPQRRGGRVRVLPGLDGQRQQPVPGRHVPGEQPGQDVPAAGIAFGEDDLPGPAEGQRQGRGGHAGRAAGRYQRVQAHGAARWVTTIATCPVAACSATAGPAAEATRRSTTSKPFWSVTVSTASTTAGTGWVSTGAAPEPPAAVGVATTST